MATVVLLLDGSYDFSQHRFLVFGEILHQQIVIGHHFRVKIIQQLSIFNLKGPLHLQINGNLLSLRGSIAALSQAVLVIGIGHGGPPVHYHPVRIVPGNAALPDIQRFLLL